MPDDSQPDFKASQSKHAQQIQTARTISRITGLTPNQVRVGLRSTDVTGGTAGGNPNAPEGTVPVSKDLPPNPTAMQFDPRPFAPTGQGGPGAAPTTPDTGTSASPYEMGENRTTTDPSAADDTWTLAGGQVPNGPNTGPFDSVVTTNPRAVFDGGSGKWVLYFRRMEFDSLGAITAIGAELAVPLT